MSAKSLAFENLVHDALKIKESDIFKVIHSGNDSKKSDINISYKGISTYIEVKMNYRAQFGTPRMKYERGKWTGVSDNPICGFVSEKVNNNNTQKDLIRSIEISEGKKNCWIGYNISHYKNYLSQTEIPDRNINLMLTYNGIKRRMEEAGNQYIYPTEISDTIVPCLLSYYIKKGALFSQIGDNFYKLADIDCTTYGIKNEVPLLKCDAKFDVRFTFRKKNQWIETIPTIKLLNLPESKYSIIGKTSPLLE